MAAKENDLIMCTVIKIEGTTVFVESEDKMPASIVFSEIAAGRIRNIREYVNPGKKIVCKVLKVLEDHVELTLRRVTGAEREEIQERYKNQKSFESIIKATTKEPQKVIVEIKKEYELWEFYDLVKENHALLKKYVSAEELEAISKTLQEKKDKEKIVKKIITIKTSSETGLKDIKEILEEKNKNIQINYLGSSQFAITAVAKDFKDASHLVEQKVKEIEVKAKAKKAVFETKEK